MAKDYSSLLEDYKSMVVFLTILAGLWILYRYGFLSIIDAFAVGILALAGLIYGVSYLFRKKFIRLG